MTQDGSRDSGDERVRLEAADWFARMHGAPTPNDAEDLERWLASDPRHRDAYARLGQRWDQSAFLANGELGRSRDLNRIERTTSWRRRAAAILLPGLILAGIGGSIIYQRRTPQPPAAEFADAQSLSLPDGSRVLLEKGALFHLAYSPAERRVLLDSGAARFFVAHDASRRFLVEAGAGAIVAHGTIFDVRIADNAVRVRLLEGKIEVIGPQAQGAGRPRSTVLGPGQSTSFTAGHSMRRERAVSRGPGRAALPADMLVFEGTPLSDAVVQFNRRNATKIRLEYPAAGQLKVTGAFRAIDPAGFAAATAAVFHVTSAIEADGTVVIR